MAASLTDQFQMLRARIETSMKAPYALLISSALPTDGKNVCAHGLAESLAGAGHRTLLVDLDHDSPSALGLPAVKSFPVLRDEAGIRSHISIDPKTGVSFLSLAGSELRASASTEHVATLLGTLRHSFDAIVIEAASLLSSGIGVIFATQCDAVIVTARENRSVCSQDRALMELLEREEAKFFGVVSLSGKAISRFNVRPLNVEKRYTTIAPAAAMKPDPSMGQ
jgi:receptor protein-tyrosine kinase